MRSEHWRYYAIWASRLLVLALLLMLSVGCQPLSSHQATAEETAAPSRTPTPSVTPSASATSTPSLTPTITSWPTRTATPTTTATATPIPLPSNTPTVTPTVGRWPTPMGAPRTLRVPILMYHYLSEPPPDADAIRIDLSVSPGVFGQQLELLVDEGYNVISLVDLTLALQSGYTLPPKPIVLTFDDGYRDAYEWAYPALAERGLSATFFIVTGFIDEGYDGYLTWDQVREMDAGGMDIQSHAHTHVDLRDRDVEYLVWQLLGSKEAIEARTSHPVHFFCYPSGRYDEQVIKVLHSAHYWAAVTTKPGATQHSDIPYELERIRVHGSYSAENLLSAIEQTMTSAEESLANVEQAISYKEY